MSRLLFLEKKINHGFLSVSTLNILLSRLRFGPAMTKIATCSVVCVWQLDKVAHARGRETVDGRETVEKPPREGGEQGLTANTLSVVASEPPRLSRDVSSSCQELGAIFACEAGH